MPGRVRRAAGSSRWSRNASDIGIVERAATASAQQRRDPADRGDERLRQRREHELPEGAAGIDETRGEGAPLGRHALAVAPMRIEKLPAPAPAADDDAEEEDEAEAAIP